MTRGYERATLESRSTEPRVPPRAGGTAAILALQRSAGNRAVAALVRAAVGTMPARRDVVVQRVWSKSQGKHDGLPVATWTDPAHPTVEGAYARDGVYAWRLTGAKERDFTGEVYVELAGNLRKLAHAPRGIQLRVPAARAAQIEATTAGRGGAPHTGGGGYGRFRPSDPSDKHAVAAPHLTTPKRAAKLDAVRAGLGLRPIASWGAAKTPGGTAKYGLTPGATKLSLRSKPMGYPVYSNTDNEREPVARAPKVPLVKTLPDVPTGNVKSIKTPKPVTEAVIRSRVGAARIPTQLTVMKGVSARDAAAARGYETGGLGWEWLHLIAHGMGGEQRAGNLVAGTAEANTEMMVVEDAVKKLLCSHKKAKATVKVIAKLVPNTHIAKEIQYEVTWRDAGGVTPFRKTVFQPLTRRRPAAIEAKAVAAFAAIEAGLSP